MAVKYSTSKQLIKNVISFMDIRHYGWIDRLLQKQGVFYGWGRKKSGLRAIALAKKHHTSFVLLEDGFIRSIGLGVDGSPSFSIVEDDTGIYYDATAPSKLEYLLNTYDFAADSKLMGDAKRAMALIRKHKISKYNNAPMVDERFRIEYGMTEEHRRVLVIAQTAGDASLTYGMLSDYTTEEMVEAAIAENPGAIVYLKVHPDVLSGKKKSDIDIEKFQDRCTIITENVNPISLLEHFDKVYTKTSQMGFEALLVGCECVCLGMPFYAGWGIEKLTMKNEKLKIVDGVNLMQEALARRKAKRSLEEVFAAAYILYTRYYNPYRQRECDIFEVIAEIIQSTANKYSLL